MGYPRSLQDYSDAELNTELRARKEARHKGLCDYCHRLASLPPCAEPTRHTLAEKIYKSSLCQNCGRPDPDNDHWDDLDGPNRAGWICSPPWNP